MIFEEIKPFQKEIKRISKHFKTIRNDIEVLKKVLKVSPEARPPLSVELNGLGLKPIVTKINKMPCRSLPGRGANTGLKIIYAYYQQEQRIVFVEIFFKWKKSNADIERVKMYLE